MNNKPSRVPEFFGITGLIGAILSLFFSLIPYIGLYAIIFSFVSIIFCIIPFLYSKENREGVRISLPGLIIGILAISISMFQHYIFNIVNHTKKEIEDKFIERIEEDLDNKLEKDSIY